ncbi:MAG TPA: DUF3048 domain-containing protein [Clostridia bacterium]|nr:DUF3048 domain-containing protein [Clostridia bacterium]
MKRSAPLILLIIFLLFTMSCGAGESPPEETTEPTLTTTTTAPVTTAVFETEPTETQAPPISASLLFPDRYPVAFMINNTAAARPQSGLDKAKLIYQMMTEGRTTRLLLLTDAREGVIGPVRSARPAYLDLVAQHQAFYCYAGNYRVIEASPLVNKIRILDALKGHFGIFYRSDHRVAPHNLYTTMEKVYRAAEKDRPPLMPEKPVEGLHVSDEFVLPQGGEPIAELQYRFSGLKEKFQYDRDKTSYIKYNDGTALVDEQTRELVTIANIIVLYRPHGLMPNGVHNKINWVDKGEATYLTGGMKYDITWEKTSHTDPIVYQLDGEELILNPGLTWIIVVDDQARKTVAYLP